MAKVKFPRQGGTSLPRRCIVCGTRGCDFHEVYVRVLPVEGNLLPGGVDEYGRRVVGLTMTMPLCPEHQGHFFWPNLLRWLGIAAIIAVALLCLVIGSALGSFLFIPITIVLLIGMAVGFFIFLSRMMRGKVHISDISRNYITFSNVAREFARAYEEEDEDGRPRRRRDEEDEPLPRSTKGVGIGGLLAALGIMAGLVVLIIVVGLIATRQAWGPLGLLMNGPPKGGNKDGAPKDGNPRDGNPRDGQPRDGRPGPERLPSPEDLLKVVPQPQPADPALKEEMLQRHYLSDLQEGDVVKGWGNNFGKNGMLGFPAWSPNPNGNDPILVGGKSSPKGVSFLPPERGVGRVAYQLGGQYKLFAGQVALADLPPQAGGAKPESAVWFTVWGDGRLLWKSREMQKAGEAEPFRVQVAGVKALELRVINPGTGKHARTVWLDPALYR